MSAANTPQDRSPPLTSRELAAVDGVLKDVKAIKSSPDITVTTAPPDTETETPPAAFGAGGPMLKQFDQSNATSRIMSQASTPPRSVVGIGGKVAKPDYSEAKIVLAMVGLPPHRRDPSTIFKSTFRSDSLHVGSRTSVINL
ncbi:hypothetical protein BD414DRAFT_138619 [Trametes punicea]|nr:hypothetical protein BD414DRAFT_138619 [Trametes punicea]